MFIGMMLKFCVVCEIKMGKIYGLKLLDIEKMNYFEVWFVGLKKLSEGEIVLNFNYLCVVKMFEVGKMIIN